LWQVQSKPVVTVATLRVQCMHLGEEIKVRFSITRTPAKIAKKVVSVNILNEPNSCPECGRDSIFRYGIKLQHPLYVGRWERVKAWLNGSAARYQKEKSELRRLRLYGEAFCLQHHVTYAITPKPALCPSCGQDTLVFDYGVLAD